MIAAALFAVELAWWALHRLPPASGGSSPAASLPPEQAYQRAMALHRAGEFRAALPFYRRAIDGLPEARYEVHFAHAATLHTLIIAHRTTHGTQVPLTRSSDEEATLAHEAMAEYQVAARLATRPEDRARILLHAGDLYRVWGLAWEAFAAYREGQALDPTNPALAARGDALMLLLEHPERNWPGSEPTP